MSARFCADCGRTVSGELEGIRLTICCLSCCRKFESQQQTSYAGIHRCSGSLAREARTAFAELRHAQALPVIKSLVYEDNGPPLRLYLGAELTRLTRGLEERPYKSILSSNKARLEQELGVKLPDIDPVLRSFLLGNYTSHRFEEEAMDRIKKRAAVLGRVGEIRRQCPLAHPESLFEFCMHHPEGTLQEFQDLKASVRQIFSEVGYKIMNLLTAEGREMLMETALEDVALQYEKTGRRPFIFAILEAHLGGLIASEIMKHPACQLRISRDVNAEDTAKRLMKFWATRKATEYRRDQVWKEFLTAGGAEVLNWNIFYDYTHGEFDCEVEELVGVNRIFQAKMGKKRFRQQRIAIALTNLEESLIKRQMSLNDSVREAISFATNVKTGILQQQNSWDYKQLTKGFWTKKLF